MRVFNINGVAGGYESLTTATAVGPTSARYFQQQVTSLDNVLGLCLYL